MPTAPPPTMKMSFAAFTRSLHWRTCPGNASASGNARGPCHALPVATMSASHLIFSPPSSTTQPPLPCSLSSSTAMACPTFTVPFPLWKSLSYGMSALSFESRWSTSVAVMRAEAILLMT